MAEEVWRDIAGYEGSYQVSDRGRVRSLPRVASDGRRVRGTYLRGSTANRGGRRQIKLMRDGRYSARYVTRLVAEAFVPNPDGLRSVRHINGDQLDDRAENLEWCDQPTNAAERWSEERAEPVTRGDGRRYGSMTEAAADMGVSVHSIRAAVESGGTCLGYTFKRSSSKRRGGYLPEMRYWGNTVVRVGVDGPLLKRLMTERRVTVKRLASESGVSETKIWRMRAGKMRPTPEELERLSAALGVDPSELRLPPDG